MSRYLQVLADSVGRLDPLKSLLWALIVGVAVGSYSYAGVLDHLGTLDTSNDLRKTEISRVNGRIDEIQRDRGTNLKELREWRESTAKQLGRIEAILEDHWGHS